MPLISIKDAEDPRIAGYLNVRERDLAGRCDHFIVEGKVTLDILLQQSRFAPESLLLAESRLAALSQTLEACDPAVPIYAAPQAVMDGIAGFPMHRGVLALARRGAPLRAADLLEEIGEPASTLVVLCGLSNHDNVGAAFRNAAAFGADAVLLDAESCDPLYRKSIRVSAGAALWLPFAREGSAADLVHLVKARGYAAWALTPRADAASIHEIEPPLKLALILGAEGPGLPDEIIAAGRPVRIPIAGGVDSLNVATAGAVALSQVFGRRS
ncbi:MAG: RNA methyltransferase [Pseudomonadota bacterium]